MASSAVAALRHLSLAYLETVSLEHLEQRRPRNYQGNPSDIPSACNAFKAFEEFTEDVKPLVGPKPTARVIRRDSLLVVRKLDVDDVYIVRKALCQRDFNESIIGHHLVEIFHRVDIACRLLS